MKILRALPFALLLVPAVLPAQSAERVRVLSLDGRQALLDQWSVAEDGALVGRPVSAPGFGEALPAVGEQKRWRLPASSLWRMQPLQQRAAEAAAQKPAAEGGLVQLRAGALLPAEFLGGDAKQWKLRIGFGEEKSEGSVPYPLLQALRLEKAVAENDGGFAAALESPSESRDYIFYWDKDKKRLRRLSALVRGFADGAFLAERGERQLRIPQDRVYGIVFSRLGGIDSGANKGATQVAIQLVDGKSLAGELRASSAKERLGLRLFGAIDIELPFQRVRKLEWLSPRMAYVSALESKILRKVPPLEAEPKLRMDRGLGGELRLGSERYQRGLLIGPGLTVSFVVPESMNSGKLRLLGRLGMPSAPFGGVQLRVRIGDELQGEPFELSADGKIHELALDLVDAKELVLEVVPGQDLDAGGQVVLGELRLLQPGP